ncbi:MAG: DUF433 domain-containing protein [Candidatus Riflebacteria bacterium]|nr:DUF433 domain-containing protein [Candidatus Riflebacteria bacterium]
MKKKPSRANDSGVRRKGLARRTAAKSGSAGASPVPPTSKAGRHERLSSDPAICGGKVCIKGTRISVAHVLGCLASGMSVEEILDEYETLEREKEPHGQHVQDLGSGLSSAGAGAPRGRMRLAERQRRRQVREEEPAGVLRDRGRRRLRHHRHLQEGAELRDLR